LRTKSLCWGRVRLSVVTFPSKASITSPNFDAGSGVLGRLCSGNFLTTTEPVFRLYGIGARPFSIIRSASCRRHNAVEARCNFPLKDPGWLLRVRQLQVKCEAVYMHPRIAYAPCTPFGTKSWQDHRFRCGAVATGAGDCLWGWCAARCTTTAPQRRAGRIAGRMQGGRSRRSDCRWERCTSQCTIATRRSQILDLQPFLFTD
jgi:hypothetical protein